MYIPKFLCKTLRQNRGWAYSRGGPIIEGIRHYSMYSINGIHLHDHAHRAATASTAANGHSH